MSLRFFKPFVISICILAVSPLQAQITTDGTLGPAGQFTGPHCRIEAELGKQVGGNLFHSFKDFNINTGESATFTGPDSVENIISRVTGGTESRIDGWLRSEIPDADLYLLNPGGVIFGKNAVLDIGGSFHVSTADYLRLKDSGRFDAIQPEMSNLTAAAPSAFGFLTDDPKGIAVEGRLVANPGQILSAIGGDIDIRGGALAVESGQIHIAATASPGEIIPTDSGLEAASSGQQGKISISEGAQINVMGDSSGDIHIRGGQFEITGEGTSLISKTGNGDGGGIDIRVSEDMAVRDGAILSTAGFGMGRSGDISLNAANLKMTDGGIADATALSSGHGGVISVTAASVEISGYGQSYKSGLYAETGGSGDAGSISVSSDKLTIADNGTLSALTVGEGKGGEVSLNVKNLDITDGGMISTAAFGSGRSGDISVKATESAAVSGTGILGTDIFRSSLDASAYSDSDGGNISVETDSLTVSNDGLIQSVTKGNGQGGDISMTADNLEIGSGGQILTDIFSSGHGGNISITARESVSVSGEGESGKSGLYADAMPDSSGDAGNITVSTGIFTVSGQGKVSGTTGGTGNAGGIAIHAGSITISDNGLITNGTSGRGNSGNIFIETDRLELDRGYISSSPENKEDENSGHGGDIAIIAADSVRIAGSGQNDKGLPAEYYGIYAQTQGDGDGGNITINSDRLTITQDAMINGQTYGSGKGGDVTLEVARLEVSQGGVITTSTRGAGNSGDISVTAKESVNITGAGVKIEKGSAIYSATHSSGSGGDLTISAPVLMLRDKGRILAGTILSDKTEENNTLPEGPGGDIHLDIGVLEMRGNTSISSESDGTGDAGFVGIHASGIWLTEGSRITTDAKISGGGRIAIDSDTSFHLSDSEISTSVSEGTGNGGDIRIGNPETGTGPKFVTLNHSNIRANADAGDGGAVFIAAENYFRSSDSVTQASSKRGNEGRVRIETPDVDLTGSLTLLPGNFLDVSRWLKTPCAQRSGEKTSRFAFTGPDVMPLSFDDWLPSPPFRCDD